MPFSVSARESFKSEQDRFDCVDDSDDDGGGGDDGGGDDHHHDHACIV